MKIIALIIALFLSACSTTDYDKYAHAQEAIATSRATAETARYDALARIAETGDPQSKIAAVMAIAMGGQGASGVQNTIQAPQPNQALQWASILLPAVTQIYGIQQNARVAINSSNNAAAVAVSTNSTFAGMGQSIATTAANGNQANIDIATAGTAAMTLMSGKIQAPAANITTTTTTNNTTTSLAGTGVMGSGSYATSADQTLSGAGTMGSGDYATPVSTSTSSTNASTTTDTVDNHTTTTPAPVVVNTPVTPTVPVIVNPPVVVNPPTVITPVTPTVPVINQPVVVPDTIVIPAPVTP